MPSPEAKSKLIAENRKRFESQAGRSLRIRMEYGRLLTLARKDKFCFEEKLWWKQDFETLEAQGFGRQEVEWCLRADLAVQRKPYLAGQSIRRGAKISRG